MNFDFLLDIKSFRHLDHQINNIHDLDQKRLSEVCDSLPVLVMKMKDIQTGKDKKDALLSLTVMEEKLIVCKASSPIIASSKF